MTRSLLSLVFHVVALPLNNGTTAPSSYVQCVRDGVYVANSTYEANRRHLAAVLPAEMSAAAGGSYRYAYRAVGYWPNRLQASAFCRRRRGDGANGTGTSSSYAASCAACLAGAFLEMHGACPYHREAFFSGQNCSLELGEFRIFGDDGLYRGNILKLVMASGVIFEAIGFAWLFFLLLQDWRARKKGTMMRSSESSPLLSGD